MDGDKTWILKILTGPHVGSEAALSPGVYLLGKDDDCDIVLHDTSLADRHFQLTLETDKVVLKVLATDHPYYIDGVAIDADSVEVNPYQVISVGTFFFTLGFANETWPPVELLGAERNFKHAEEQTTEEDAEKDDGKPLPSSFLPIAAWRRLRHGKSPISRVYLSVGIALIGIGVSLLSVVFTADDIIKDGLKAKTAEINDLIEEYVVDATVRNVSVDGQRMLYIQGYTKTDEQRDAFMEALGKANVTARTQLYSSERLKLAVSVILDQFLNPETDNVEVVGVSGFPGKVMLSGYVEKNDVWERVLAMIETDVSGLQGYYNRVYTMDDAVHALEKMLVDQGLSDKVTINIMENTIYLSVQTLSASEQQRLTALSKNFRDRFADQPQLTYGEQGKSQIKELKLDVGLQSVSFGESPYLETQEGKRYTIGALIDDDYVIKEINREFILLSKEGVLGRYYFNTDMPATSR